MLCNADFVMVIASLLDERYGRGPRPTTRDACARVDRSWETPAIKRLCDAGGDAIAPLIDYVRVYPVYGLPSPTRYCLDLICPGVWYN